MSQCLIEDLYLFAFAIRVYWFTQQPGILGNHILGPLFIPENVTLKVKLNMIKITIDHLITQ